MTRVAMPEWRAHLVRLALVMAALLLIFASDVADMASIWWNVSTYTHCLFVLPIIGWLIWQRRREVLTLTPQGDWRGIALVFFGAVVWMLGEAAGIALFRHAAVVFMLQASVFALLGQRVLRGLLFPVFYLVFLIPFGDELVPQLQTITAKLSMIFLGWASIPAHIEGVFISIPTGLFEVAEACSGVKFLVAMVAYSALTANVCFKSWKRRVAFLTMAMIVPILANGLRAYGTIHVSYATGSNDFAEGFDHIIFGWVFFALVMAMVVAIGWRFFDRPIDAPWLGNWAATPAARAANPGLPYAALILGAALIPVGWQSVSSKWWQSAVSGQIALPQIPNWTRGDIVQSYPWRPRFDGADHKLFGQYVDKAGRRVDLSITIYGRQAEGRELVGYAQGAFDPSSRWSWANSAQNPQKGVAARIFAPGVERIVWSFYRINGKTTGSATRVKLETLVAKLTGDSQAGVAILVSAETSKTNPAHGTLEQFVRDMGGAESIADTALKSAKGI